MSMSEPNVSPYLRRPLRSYEDAVREVRERFRAKDQSITTAGSVTLDLAQEEGGYA